jgi:hypothetical protein
VAVYSKVESTPAVEPVNTRKLMSNIILFHQNIQSLSNKIDELSITMHNNGIDPHFICLSEHFLKESEIAQISLKGYSLAASYSRVNFLGGGLCIFTKKKSCITNH